MNFQLKKKLIMFSREIADRIKLKKSAFDNLSDEQMKQIENASVDHDVIDRIRKAGMFIVQNGEIDSIVEKAKYNVEFFSELLTRLKEYEALIADEKQKTVEQIQGDCIPKHKHKSDIEVIRESLRRVETDPVFAKKVLIESGIYDEDMKLTPAYKYDGIEREKHEEAVLIIKEIKKRHTVGDYWIPNIDSTTKTTLILYGTNIDDNIDLYSEMKEILDNSRFFDNIFSNRSPIVKYKDMLKE